MILHLVQFTDPDEGPELQVLTTKQWENWLDYSKRSGVETHKKIKEIILTPEEVAKLDITLP